MASERRKSWTRQQYNTVKQVSRGEACGCSPECVFTCRYSVLQLAGLLHNPGGAFAVDLCFLCCIQIPKPWSHVPLIIPWPELAAVKAFFVVVLLDLTPAAEARAALCLIFLTCCFFSAWSSGLERFEICHIWLWLLDTKFYLAGASLDVSKPELIYSTCVDELTLTYVEHFGLTVYAQ